MELKDVKTFKAICITRHTVRRENEKINKLLAKGWVILDKHEDSSGSSLLYLGNKEFVDEETE